MKILNKYAIGCGSNGWGERDGRQSKRQKEKGKTAADKNRVCFASHSFSHQLFSPTKYTHTQTHTYIPMMILIFFQIFLISLFQTHIIITPAELSNSSSTSHRKQKKYSIICLWIWTQCCLMDSNRPVEVVSW